MDYNKLSDEELLQQAYLAHAAAPLTQELAARVERLQDELQEVNIQNSQIYERLNDMHNRFEMAAHILRAVVDSGVQHTGQLADTLRAFVNANPQHKEQAE